MIKFLKAYLEMSKIVLRNATTIEKIIQNINKWKRLNEIWQINCKNGEDALLENYINYL